MTSDLLLFLSLHFATFLTWSKAVFLANEIFPIVSDPVSQMKSKQSIFFKKNNFAFQSLEVQDVPIVSLVAQCLSVHFGNDSE